MNDNTGKPLAIDLFTGLHGWSDGLVAEGWRVVGFDLEDMCAQFGAPRPDGVQLVLQDVLTLHGKQFKDAALIVASPPCQEYSYMAMPWSRAKAIAAEYRNGARDTADLTRLFDACFRIQREAIEAAGHFIPLVVENVRGAIPWVGRSRWNFGSFHLWGDVPALMPMVSRRAVLKDGVTHRSDGTTNFHGHKVPGFRFDGSGKSFQTASVEGIKNTGGSWFNIAHNTTSGHSNNPVSVPAEGFKTTGMNWSDRSIKGQDFTRVAGKQAAANEATKIGGDWFSDPNSTCRKHGSKSKARKAASAAIAKIPFALASHIAQVYRP